MHAKQFSSPTEEPKPRRHFVQGGWPFLPKNPFLQVQCRLPGMVELDPAGQARQVNAEAEDATAGVEAADNEAEGALLLLLLLLLLSMGEKNPTGQPLLPTADSNETMMKHGKEERKGKESDQFEYRIIKSNIIRKCNEDRTAAVDGNNR